MVRNVDLPEAIVFYGLESVLEPPSIKEEVVASEDDSDDAQPHDNHLKLRSGIFRILQECQEVGTAVLILSEVDRLKDGELHNVFNEAWMNNSYDSDSIIEKKLQTLLLSDDAEENPTVSFRCIDTKFTIPPYCPNDDDDEFDDNDSYDASSYYYNLLSVGKSPSPAFLLDSLQSVRVNPRGFGGSSGFARGQWVEPRRCPLTARTVVFVAGDWKSDDNNNKNNNNLPWLENYWDDEGKITSSVRDRCAAARAAGCRIVYLENLDPNNLVQDDEHAISRCDAIIETYGTDNLRDLQQQQPISLDAISTPGDYWLNPPLPRDDSGNNIAVDDVVEWFRVEREMESAVSGDLGCIVVDDSDVDDGQMSEDEMARILADLD